MILEDKVYKYICDKNMLEDGEAVVVGVSGGADSVCLLSILADIGRRMHVTVHAVHINHGIRGEEADADEKYVLELCETMGVTIDSLHYNIPELSQKNGKSEEEMGRIIRYKAFEQMRIKYNASKIAVAHNTNDSVETIIYNMCRGTGIKGVTGIPPVRGNIIRPLLCATRQEIEDYVRNMGIEFRTDSTNLKCDYTRNRIRLELLPYINKNINEKSSEHILSLADQLNDIQVYISSQVDKVFGKIVKTQDDVLVIRGEMFLKEASVIGSEIIRKCISIQAGKLKDVTRTHIDIVLGIIKGGSGKKADLPYGLQCENVYGDCRIYKKNNEKKNQDNVHGNCISVDVPGKYTLQDGSVMIFEWEKSVKFEEKIYTKWFDYDKISNVVQIRRRENGDYFKVKNGGRKKLKDYFIDEKIPREDRDNIPVLADGNHIIWIVGHRISETYKVSDSTQKVLKVQYIAKSRGGMTN